MTTLHTPKYARKNLDCEKGLSILELLIAMAIFSTLAGVAVNDLSKTTSPLANATFELSHYLRLIRSRAISQTTSIYVSPDSPTQLSVVAGSDCEDVHLMNDSGVSDLVATLPDHTYLASEDWGTCFNARGFVDEYIEFEVRDNRGQKKIVEIALGGGVRFK